MAILHPFFSTRQSLIKFCILSEELAYSTVAARMFSGSSTPSLQKSNHPEIHQFKIPLNALPVDSLFFNVLSCSLSVKCRSNEMTCTRSDLKIVVSLTMER